MNREAIVAGEAESRSKTGSNNFGEPARMQVCPNKYEIQCFTQGGEKRIIFSDLNQLAVSEFDSIPGEYFSKLSFEPTEQLTAVCLNKEYNQDIELNGSEGLIRHFSPQRHCELVVRDCKSGVCIEPRNGGRVCPIRFSHLDEIIHEFAPEYVRAANVWSHLGGVIVTYVED